MFTSTSAAGSFIPIQVTEEKTTRSIIVRGKEKDLDVVDKVIREIDVRTKQVLMEVFIVKAKSDLNRMLGNRLGQLILEDELELVVHRDSSVGAPQVLSQEITEYVILD